MPKKVRKHKVEQHLPARPPKRTGRRGIKPLDAKDDETPAKVEGEPLVPAEPKKPRQPRLPSMEDEKIEGLESAAEEYATVRDNRMRLNLDEKKLKDDLHDLMKKNAKQVYHRDGIDIRIVHESETVKVKISKSAKEEDVF